MALLAASTVEPNMALPKAPNAASLLGPTGKFAFQLQHALTSVSVFLFVRMCFAANHTLVGLVIATRFLAFRLSLALRSLTAKAAAILRWSCFTAWRSRYIKRLRKRVELELYGLAVGPGGNTLFLLLFWPGWLVLAAAVVGMSMWSWIYSEYTFPRPEESRESGEIHASSQAERPRPQNCIGKFLLERDCCPKDDDCVDLRG